MATARSRHRLRRRVPAPSRQHGDWRGCLQSLPCQNPYAERLIGSIRRECLDHVIVLGERHLRRILTAYLTYYHGARTHLALEKDAPTTRRVQTPREGPVVAFPEVGGLHHRYE